MARPSPAVVVACMAGCPEERLFTAMGPVAVTLSFHADRASLVPLVRTLRPRAILFPPVDAAGNGCAPLIARIRTELPDVLTYVVIAPKSSTQGLVDAVRAGGEIAHLRDVPDVRALLDEIRGVRGLSGPENEAAAALVAGLGPPHLVEVLLLCVMRAHERLAVPDLATALDISRSALARRSRAARWPGPSELIEWGRLIYASVLMWRDAASLVALAQASGFESADALRRGAHRRLGLTTSVPQDLSPLRVSAALRRRIAASRD